MKTKFKIMILLLVLVVFNISFAVNAHAATYSYYLGEFNDDAVGSYGYTRTSVSSYNVTGYNQTQGIYQQIGGSITRSLKYGDIYYYYLNYVLPDDGSVWNVKGTVSFYQTDSYFDPNWGSYAESSSTFFVNVDATQTTSGSFSGYSPKTATDAANTAASNSSNASARATEARDYAAEARNEIRWGSYNGGKSLGATWDQANLANTYATEARNEIRFGSYNGGKSLGATYDQASAANSNANTASARTWDTVSGKSAATLAREARDNAGSASTNALNAYNEAHTANTKLDTMQTSITNIQNSIGFDTTPPVVKIRTVSGAVATSNHYIQAVLEISDNTNSITYSFDGINYEPVPANRLITLTVNNPGPNLIMVWVKDQAGNIGSTSITIRKL